MGSRVKGGLTVTRQVYQLGEEGSRRGLAVGQVERPSFDGLVLFLVLTCYITLENKNISKIIYNIYIFIS